MCSDAESIKLENSKPSRKERRINNCPMSPKSPEFRPKSGDFGYDSN